MMVPMLVLILNNEQIYNLYEVLTQLKQNENQLSIRTGFNILRNIQILEPIYQLIADARKEILLTHGELTAEGAVSIPQSKIELVNESLTELSQIENELSLNTFNLTDLDNLSLSIADIEKLFPIINGEA